MINLKIKESKMLYKITATYKQNKLKEFYMKLTDGTIAAQEPDGKEMLASMQRAKIDENNLVTWYETCFCTIPLNHERTTVYDDYFKTFIPILVEKEKDMIKGESFWQFMANQ